MFGREPECARIEQLLDRASVGPVAIVVEGAAGDRQDNRLASCRGGRPTRGFAVLEAAPAEADAALGFSGLGDLFDGLAVEAFANLPDPQRRALGAALFLSDATDASTDVEALPRAVLGVLRRLAVEATLVVAIDDEQWLDRASGRVLAFALRRIRDERICVLLSRRTGSDGPLWPALRDGFTAETDVVELAGVDVATTRRLLAACSSRRSRGASSSESTRSRAATRCTSLRSAKSSSVRRATSTVWRELPIPTTLADAIARRLDHVRAGVEAPLFAVAALADPTVALLSDALDEFDVRDLDDAVRAGVIELDGERIRFTHPLLASVHYSSVPAAERRRAASASGRRRLGPGGAGAAPRVGHGASGRGCRGRARQLGPASGPSGSAGGGGHAARARDPADAGRSPERAVVAYDRRGRAALRRRRVRASPPACSSSCCSSDRTVRPAHAPASGSRWSAQTTSSSELDARPSAR